MTSAEKNLTQRVIDLLGEQGVAERLGPKGAVRIMGYLGNQFDQEQRLSMLKILMPHLSEEELETFLAREAAASPHDEKPKPQS